MELKSSGRAHSEEEEERYKEHFQKKKKKKHPSRRTEAADLRSEASLCFLSPQVNTQTQRRSEEVK